MPPRVDDPAAALEQIATNSDFTGLTRPQRAQAREETGGENVSECWGNVLIGDGNQFNGVVFEGSAATFNAAIDNGTLGGPSRSMNNVSAGGTGDQHNGLYARISGPSERLKLPQHGNQHSCFNVAFGRGNQYNGMRIVEVGYEEKKNEEGEVSRRMGSMTLKD